MLIACRKKKNKGKMFKPNNQPALLTFEEDLSENQRKKHDNSKEKWFYELILWNINENDFKPIYSGKASRPNVCGQYFGFSHNIKRA